MTTESGMRVLVTGGSGFIGTNVIAHYIELGVPLLNLDWNPPLDPGQKGYWRPCDIMDQPSMREIFIEFAPTHVIHLAARADTDETEDMRGYLQNHEGTRLLLEVVKELPSIHRIVVTSTQFVCEAGYQPKHDQDYKPFTLYGESKKLTEDHTRNAGLNAAWTIIRPTTIWGPWSLRYRDVMFKVMRKGLYFHPSRRKVVRSYGYVGNVVWQIHQIMTLPKETIDRKVFYVGDPPVELLKWVDQISLQLTGKRANVLPTWLVLGIARFGDLLEFFKFPFPLTSSRFKSMTSDYITPMDRTEEALGKAPISIAEGAKITIDWYLNVSAGIKAHTLKDVRQKERMTA